MTGQEPAVTLVQAGVAEHLVAAEPHGQTLPGDPGFVGHVTDGSPVLDDPLDQPPSPLRRERGVLVGQPLLGAASSLQLVECEVGPTARLGLDYRDRVALGVDDHVVGLHPLDQLLHAYVSESYDHSDVAQAGAAGVGEQDQAVAVVYRALDFGCGALELPGDVLVERHARERRSRRRLELNRHQGAAPKSSIPWARR